MVTIEFEYNNKITNIKANISDIINDITKKFFLNENIDSDSVELLHNGKMVDIKEKIETLMDVLDKKNKIIKIKVQNKTNNKGKSYEIFCPKCFEPCRVKIDNYLIKLYDCKNRHQIENIELDDFINIEKITNPYLECKMCHKIKGKNQNKNYKRCVNCRINLCSDCISIHENSHKIIDINVNTYQCEIHQKSYNAYCLNCRMDICDECHTFHKEHKFQTFEEMRPNIEDIKIKLMWIRYAINSFEENVKELINDLNTVMNNMEIYYNLYDSLVNNYNTDKINYENLLNLKEIINDEIIKELNYIIKCAKNRKAYNIFNIYNKMKETNNEITINYAIKNKKNQAKSKGNNKIEINQESINILGKNFVDNNLNLCQIIYNEQLYELSPKFQINYKDHTSDILTLKLKGIQSIKKFDQMFKDCPLLLSVPDINKLDISKSDDIKGFFYNCSSLISLPDISIWDTSNIKDMSHLFSGCSSLLSLPDISSWNISNANNIFGMFSKCSSLKVFPDISKWKIKNVTNMFGIFLECSSLISLPDISRWDTENVNNLSGLFTDCNSLISLPDISKWNTDKVINLSGMFAGCSSLTSIPDISKWNISQVNNLSGMFANCSLLTSLPDISVWKTDNVNNMKFMFYNCYSLVSLPNISKWNIEKVNYLGDMFTGCKLFLNIPQKFKNRNENH